MEGIRFYIEPAIGDLGARTYVDKVGERRLDDLQAMTQIWICDLGEESRFLVLHSVW